MNKNIIVLTLQTFYVCHKYFNISYESSRKTKSKVLFQLKTLKYLLLKTELLGKH